MNRDVLRLFAESPVTRHKSDRLTYFYPIVNAVGLPFAAVWSF